VTLSDSDQLLARVATDRATVWGVLSVAFYLPDEQLVWDLREDRIASKLEAAVHWLGPDAEQYGPVLAELHGIASDLRAVPMDEGLRQLRIEHARLFTGPGRPEVAPFETAYVDVESLGSNRLYGPSAASVARWYRQFDLEKAGDHGDLPDFVATEFEFLYALAQREASARLAGLEEEARTLRRETDRFLREHPARWIPAFAARVRAASPHRVYATFAELAAVHLATELGEALDRTSLPWPAAPGSTTGRSG
jgi:putative dimethyl sulfoxide reductase chaperone